MNSNELRFKSHIQEKQYIIDECNKIPNPVFVTFSLKQKIHFDYKNSLIPQLYNSYSTKINNPDNLSKNTRYLFNIIN